MLLESLRQEQEVMVLDAPFTLVFLFTDLSPPLFLYIIRATKAPYLATVFIPVNQFLRSGEVECLHALGD